jgi:hypothetical protein
MRTEYCRVCSFILGVSEVMVLMLHKAEAQEEAPNRLRSATYALNIRQPILDNIVLYVTANPCH